jgi:hypothetical protein
MRTRGPSGVVPGAVEGLGGSVGMCVHGASESVWEGARSVPRKRRDDPRPLRSRKHLHFANLEALCGLLTNRTERRSGKASQRSPQSVAPTEHGPLRTSGSQAPGGDPDRPSLASRARDAAHPMPKTGEVTSTRCFRCNRGPLRRSRRRGTERLFSLLGFFPFRCEECAGRSWRFAPRELRSAYPRGAAAPLAIRPGPLEK